jgi:hypothetical protein
VELYVDNERGNDQNPGTLEKPFRTFKKSLEVLKGSDTLHIVPYETPYNEFFGRLTSKYSGTPDAPTVIDGHGAKLTRLTHFDASCWTDEGDDIYSQRFIHNVVVMSGKGYYDGFPFVFVDGKPLPCVKKRADLVPNSCFFYLYWDSKLRKHPEDHGMLYIKLPPGKTPADVRIVAPMTNGVIVEGSDYVTVKNINASWSASDLFDTAHGKGLVFENITAENCMDQCISGNIFSKEPVVIFDHKTVTGLEKIHEIYPTLEKDSIIEPSSVKVTGKGSTIPADLTHAALKMTVMQNKK